MQLPFGLRSGCSWITPSHKEKMSLWRKAAFERLPEFRPVLQKEKSAYLFLGEMVERLYQAYIQKDEDLIRRIYDYARWCQDAPRGKTASDDLLTIITVSFFEHLPRHAEVRRDIGRWLSKKDVEGMKAIFLYHGTEEQFQEMLSSCVVTKFKKKSNQSLEPRAMSATNRAARVLRQP
jgi:hypothetical protein